MQYARAEDFGGFWRRVAATAVDGLILYAPTVVLEVALHERIYGPLGELQRVALIPQAIVVFCVWAAYEIPFWMCPWQATPGKRILGLAVTAMDGSRLTFPRALARYVLKCLCGAVLIGFLFVPLTSWRQALHDLLAKTLVPRREYLHRLLGI